MKTRVKYLVALFLTFGFLAFGQTNKTAFFEEGQLQENLQVVFNHKTALVGETLRYQIYCFDRENDSTYSELSEIAYVTIINSAHKTLLKQKVNLVEGVGTGSFFIPPSFENGHYKLIAYTKIMLSQEKQFAGKDLVFLNPYEPIPPKNLKKDTATLISQSPKTATKNQQPLTLETDKKIYQQREKVTLTIAGSTIDPRNKYVLDVVKKDSLHLIADQYAGKSSKIKINPTGKRYAPELRGALLQGSIVPQGETAQSYDEKLLALSIPGKQSIFKVAQTNAEGQFLFELPKNESLSKSQIQVQFLQKENWQQQAKIEVDSFQVFTKNLPISPSISVPASFKKQISERSIAVQIENAYIKKKRDSVVNTSSLKPFYAPLQKEYVLDEYTSFSTVEKTLTEIIPRIHFEKKEGRSRIVLCDYINNDLEGFYGNTLVLVDGALLKNLDKLLQYNPKKISRIDDVNRGYIYGPYIFNGVINFITKNQDYQHTVAANEFTKEIRNPLSEIKPFQPNYGEQASKRIPDYRYTLFWQPHLKLNHDGKKFSFYTSDITGTFEITLKGFDQDGNFIIRKKDIKVK